MKYCISNKISILPSTRKTITPLCVCLFEKIEKISEKSMKLIRDNLPDETFFGLDGSWSVKRNASHAIVIFMDMKSQLVLTKLFENALRTEPSSVKMGIVLSKNCESSEKFCIYLYSTTIKLFKKLEIS